MTDPELWAEYRRLADISRHLRVSPRAWAIDETLEYILDHLENGTGSGCTLQQIEDKIGNAAAKFRRRGQLTDMIAATSSEAQTSSADYQIDARQRLERCTVRELQVLIDVGAGYTVEEVAARRAAPTGSIKSWTARARKKCAA